MDKTCTSFFCTEMDWWWLLSTKLREYIDTLNGVERVEVLPYHDMAKFKYKELGIEYELNDINPPTKDRIKKCYRNLRCKIWYKLK